MKNALLALLAVVLAGPAVAASSDKSASKASSKFSGPRKYPAPEKVVKSWPAKPRATARALLEKYGAPSQYDDKRLAWFQNGTWKRTVVYRDGCPNSRKSGHLEQAIGYLVPTSRVSELKSFDSKLQISETAGEISYCSDGEKRNTLAINVADEVMTGQKTASDGREFLDRTSRLSASGKSSTYNEGLLFEADNTYLVSPSGGDQ